MAQSEVGIGLGSNIGDKADNIREAMRRLCADGRVHLTALSQIYRTPPWGPVAQDFFANACALLRTAMEPLALLDLAKRIEAEMGREQTVRWGPRLIDIDILFYGHRTLAGGRLTLPHPEIFNRAFVLVPLAEVAPELRIGGKPVREAARATPDEGILAWDGR